MRYFIAILCLYLIGVDAQAARIGSSEEQPVTIHQMLIPQDIKAKPPGKCKRKQQGYERKKKEEEEQRIEFLCDISPEAWCVFSRELQQASNFEKYINLDDRGYIGVLEAGSILEAVANRTFDSFGPHTNVGYTILLNTLGDEFVRKHRLVTELDAAHMREVAESKKSSVGLCLRFAAACLDFAEVLPTTDVDIVDSMGRIRAQSLLNPEAVPLVQAADEAGLWDVIPAGFFDSNRRFYYRKAALLFYQARIYACIKFQKAHADTWGPCTLQDTPLKYDRLINILSYLNTRALEEEAWDGEFFSLSLVLNKAVHTFYISPDFMEKVSASKPKKGCGKKGRRKKKNATPHLTERVLPEEQQRERLETIQGLLLQHVDALRNGGRAMEAEYRERAAFLMRALLYKDEMNTGRVTLLGEGKKIAHIDRAMKKVDELREVLESVAHIDGTLLAHNVLRGHYTNQLLKLCDRLHAKEFADVPDEIKFRYYQQFRKLQEDGYFNSPGDSQATYDCLAGLILNLAARVSPDPATETDYYQKAASLLCPMTDDLDLYNYYAELCARELSNQDLSNRKRKKLCEQRISERAAVRTLIHLHLLSRLGREAEVNCLLEKLRTNGEAEQTKNREARRNKFLTHDQILERIRAEQDTREVQRAAEAALKEKIEAQVESLEQQEAQAVSPPFWYTLHEGGECQPQAEIQQELREAKEQRAAKEARKAQARAARTEGVGSASMAEEDEAQVSEVTPDIPTFVCEALETHRDIFEALFTRHEGEGAYNNAVSVQRDHFLRMILALGGTHSCAQGSGSHQFVRLVLGDQVVDMEALPDDLAGELERRIAAAHSRGTMTLSWPKKDRGHNRRFLLPEQIKNARLVLAANGLTPELVFGDKGPAGEDVPNEPTS